MATPVLASPVDVTIDVESSKVAYLTLLNAQRGLMGIPSVERIEALEIESQAHSDDMAMGRTTFGHEGFSLRCSNARAKLPKANGCGEIVAWGQKSAQGVFDAWMNSPHHHDCMLAVKYNKVGVGIAQREDGRLYWGALFMQQ